MVDGNELETWSPSAATLARPATPASPPRAGFSTLRAKLLGFYVFLVLALALTGTFIVTRLVAATAEERFDNHLRESSRVAADGVARLEIDHLDRLRAMAQTDGMWQAFETRDSASLQAVLAPLAADSNLQVTAAIDLQGQDVLTLFRQPGRAELAASTGADYSGLAPVSSVLAGQSDTVGDKYAAMAAFPSGAYLLSTAPVHNPGGALVGILLVGTRLDTLLADLKARTLADFVLLDQNGKLAATTLAEPEGGYGALELSANSLPATGRVITRDLQLYNRGYRAVYGPLMMRQSPAGALGVVLSSDYAASALTTSRDAFLWLIILGTLAAMAIGYGLANSISSPIWRLRSVARAAAQGDLSQTTGLRGGDEIGTLGESLDAIISRLREREQESRQLYDEMARRNQMLDEQHARLEAAQQQLARSDKLAAVGQLAAGMVHEVKNPLSAIIGTVDLMRETQPGPQSEQELKIVRESAVKANKIVSDLLRFTRPAEPEFDEHDLRLTVANALQLIAHAARERNVRLKANLPPEAVDAYYDDNQIEQVLVNLLHNGLQAMPDGGMLTVYMRPTQAEVVVAVQDTGSGIAPEDLQRVFDPFFSTKPAGEGTGLGLSVSYDLAAANGGRLEAASIPGKGSIFSLWLPLRQPDSVEEQAPANVRADG